MKERESPRWDTPRSLPPTDLMDVSDIRRMSEMFQPIVSIDDRFRDSTQAFLLRLGLSTETDVPVPISERSASYVFLYCKAARSCFFDSVLSRCEAGGPKRTERRREGPDGDH